MNNIVRRTLFASLLGLAIPLFGASPEVLVGQAVPTPATLLRFLPSVASNGTDFFVVWMDNRSGSSSIIGTRVNRDGDVLDPYGTSIAAARSTSAPRVVWDGESYLVVWTQWEDPNADRSVFAARVGTHGGLVMLPRLIAEGATTESGRFVASNGTVSLIAYRNDSSDLRIAALDRDGNTLHHETLSDGSEYPRDPSVAAGTSRFVVAWNERAGYLPAGDAVKAIALTASGHVIDPPKTVLPGAEPAIASDGTRFVIVSLKNDDWREYSLLSRTFDGNLDPVNNEHAILVDDGMIAQTSILWLNGNHYEVFAARATLSGATELVSIELDPSGNFQPPPRSRGSIAGDTLSLQLSVGTNGTDVLVVRVADGPQLYGNQIVAQMYRGNATAPDETKLLSWSGNVHREPDIVSSAFGHFIAWTEDDGVYATRVDRNGNSLDGRGIRLSTMRTANDRHARVAFDGTNYIVAWRDDGFVGIRQIAPLSGLTVAETKVPVEGRPNLALAGSPDATYLVFTDERVRVTRIPHDTHTPDPVPLAVSPEDMDVSHVAAAWNGSTLLVTWAEELYLDSFDPPARISIKIHAARVSASLSLLDPAPLLIAAPPGEQDTFGPPSVASNGTDWLVVVTSFASADILARRVLLNGTVEGTAPVKIGEGVQPVTVWDGVRYAVAWKEGDSRQLERPLVLSAVQASGALTATHRVFVSSATAGSTPSITPAGNGETAVAYTKVSNRPEHAGVERSFFRVMNLGAQRGRVVRR
jgi:hypothetical protein